MSMTRIKDNKIQQYLGTIETYNLEESFEDAIRYLQEQAETYKADYVNEASSVLGEYPENDDYYNRKANTNKVVQFDRIFLTSDYDPWGDHEHKELQVWGERELLPEEKEAIAAKHTKTASTSEQREKDEYERLKKKFER